MAISTYKAFLMKGTGETPTYEKLIDIKDFPDLGGAPEMLKDLRVGADIQSPPCPANYAEARFRLAACLPDRQ